MRYKKTEAGQIAFKTRSGAIPTKLRSLFILFDGSKSLFEVLQMGTVLGATLADVQYLVDSGLLAPTENLVVAHTAPRSAALQVAPFGGAETEAEIYSKAMPIATKITANLGLRGFRLNLAVEAAMGYADLCALFPKIREAVGANAAKPLEVALRLQSS